MTESKVVLKKTIVLDLLSPHMLPFGFRHRWLSEIYA
jgi:hypothetical protein